MAKQQISRQQQLTEQAQREQDAERNQDFGDQDSGPGRVGPAARRPEGGGAPGRDRASVHRRAGLTLAGCTGEPV